MNALGTQSLAIVVTNAGSMTALISTPSEGHCTWTIGSFLDQGFVELSAGARMNCAPATLTVVLQAGDVGTKKWRELSTAAHALALVTQLIV